jgi:hypothetical protein
MPSNDATKLNVWVLCAPPTVSYDDGQVIECKKVTSRLSRCMVIPIFRSALLKEGER